MIKVIYKEDALAKENKVEHANSIGQWLTQNYDHMPDHLHIFYHTSNMDSAEISVANEVTPKTAAELAELDLLVTGTFIVIENPKGIEIGAAVWAVIISLTVSVAVALLMPVPTVPQTNQNNNQSSSANNELANRENKTRINGRIPDIYGRIWSTPDLIAVPYTTYENNVEVENIVGVIGRGHYDIKSAWDGDTRIVDIAGASVEVFHPGVDIVSGQPYFSVGSEITTLPLAVQKQTSVNGQIMRPADTQSLTGTSYIAFGYPNELLRASGNTTDLTAKFVSNDRIKLTNARFTDSKGGTRILDGEYKVLSVADDRITLSDPAAVNTDWLSLKDMPNQKSPNLSPTIESLGEKWIGPFVLDNKERNRILANFVASNGLYTVQSDGRQSAAQVTLEVEVTPLDEFDNEIGFPQTQQIVLKGSSKSRQTVGATLDMTTFQGRCKVRARRVNASGVGSSVVDEVKWQALYGAYPMQETVYQHETVFRARTYATTGALSVKERKINFDLERMLPTYKNGAMTSALFPTSSFADALVAMALDEKIGRRTIDEIDLDNIYQTYQDIVDYFGTPLAGEFCTTFDDTNTSFEELVQMLCDAVFCTGYRQNNKLRLYFEKPTNNSVLLFNFRNKIPDSEKREINFGIVDDYDGLVYEWTDPVDDSRVNIYLPDRGAKNPKEVKSVGVRNRWQAHFNAWRLWNKLKFQHTSITFDACAESELLVLRDRILVADNRKQEQQSGEIEQQNGLILKLSHEVKLSAGKAYVIYLQMGNGSVDLIPVKPVDVRHVQLERLPLYPLNLENNDFIRTVYTVVSDEGSSSLPFLLAEKSPVDKYANTLTAVNYDERYYLNDRDFGDVPVDESPLVIRYDQLDINLAQLWKMQRGELPTNGEITFEISPGILVASSSSYRPDITQYYKFNSSYAEETVVFTGTPEIPAIDTGIFPPDLTVTLVIKGNAVGRGGDGGVPHTAYYSPDSPPAYIQRRDGFKGAPGLNNQHTKLKLIIDGGTLARGGSGGGAGTAHKSYSGGSSARQGTPGGGGAPYGRVLSGIVPDAEYVTSDGNEEYTFWFSRLHVYKQVNATKTMPGQGYFYYDSFYNLNSSKSGNGGGWGKVGTVEDRSTMSSLWRPLVSELGKPGAGGPAITGITPLSIELKNGGQILQTI